MDFINFCGYRIKYEFHQNNKPETILFLSGAFQNIQSWKRFKDHFYEDFNLIFIDLPGCGDSDFLPSHYPVNFLADSVISLLNTLKVGQVQIISASYGTPIGYLFAQKHPERVSHLILCGMMKEFPDHLVKNVQSSLNYLYNGERENFANKVVSDMLCSDPNIKIEKRKLVHKVLYESLVKMSDDAEKKYISNTLRILNTPPLDYVNAPKVPSLLYTGEFDVFTYPESCQAAASCFPNAIYTTITHCDHCFHLEKYSVCAKLMEYFIKDKNLKEVEDITSPIRYAA